MATKSATVSAAHLTSAPLKETINQELYAVIGDSQPSLSLVSPLQLTDKRPTKKWRERKFVHQGRKDGLQLSHWVTVDEDSELEDKGDYPFAKYSTPTTIYNYGDEEYTKYLEDERETGWSKAETDYLFRLLNDYALRFYIVADRYEWAGSERHVEDLKARYYAICRKLFKARPLDSPTEQENRNTGTVQYGFDYAKEKSRREFIENLWNRDPATVAEEDILYLDLKRLEQTERKFARERDTLLRNLAGIESGLSGIDIQEDGLVGWGGNPADLPQPKRQGGRNRKSLRGAADLDYELSSHPGSNMVISLGGSLPNRNLMPPAQQAAFDAKHCIMRAPPNLVHSSKNTHTPVHVRSSKFPPMKQQALARIQQILQELEINSSRLVMPTKENIEHMEKLITVCQQLADARKPLEKLEDELRAQKIKMGLPVDPAPTASTGANASAAGDGSPTTVTRGTSAGAPVAGSQSRKRTMSVSSSVDSSATGPIHKRSRIS